jgi:hypothetical protein
MSAVQDDSCLLSDFLDWLNAQPDLRLTGLDIGEGGYRGCYLDPERLLARYFGIDLDKVETEKREILAYIRLQNAEKTIRKELCLKPEPKP